jgi:hypothetical protein
MHHFLVRRFFERLGAIGMFMIIVKNDRLVKLIVYIDSIAFLLMESCKKSHIAASMTES